MARYIEVGELKEWILNWSGKNKHYHPYSKSDTIPIPELYDILEWMPTADVRENVKGEWVYQSFGGYHCNQCGNQAPFWCMASTQNLTDFCPNCGAEMERSDNG